MKNILIILSLILLSGCSFNSLFGTKDIDKITIVNYSTYMKHHRSFLSRNDLKILIKNHKYIYMYHKNSNRLSVLVHRKNAFILHSLSDPKKKIHFLYLKTYKSALKYFRSKGYRVVSPSTKGFIVKVSKRKYNGTKTLMFETKDYTKLLKLYKNGISKYNANNIKTKLPTSLILSYFRYYEKRAKTNKQLAQLDIIAKKLKIKMSKPIQDISVISSTVSQTPIANSQEKEKEEQKSEEKEKSKQTSVTKEDVSWYNFHIDKPVVKEKPIIDKQPTPLPYTYYLSQASLNEIRIYLSKKETNKALSRSKYLKLKEREKTLEEKKLLNEGSLEELIAAYKRNKKPKFKQRILSLMKEKQQ